jgi:hypothetical protein
MGPGSKLFDNQTRFCYKIVDTLMNGGILMKGLKKSIYLSLLVFLFIGFLGSNGWAQTQDWKISNDELNIVDLFIVRPLGIVAAAGGTCLFVASLIFTLPTRSVGESFNLFVVEPWKFSFVRDFPDESTY